MKALITGITGFAGTHLAEHLLASGDEVLGCSLHGRWHDSTPAELPKQMRMLRWDITQPGKDHLLQKIAEFGPDVVYHLAAISVPAQCGDKKPTRKATTTNTDGSTNAMKLASACRIPRLLFISSRHVYGQPSDTQHCQREISNTIPRSAYGETKLAAELMLRSIVKRHGIELIIARAFNHAGPRQLPPLMLAQWCDQLARGQTTLAIQNDNTWLDLSDVRDVVRAYRMLAMQGENCEAYNVGSGSAVRTGDVARRLVEHALPGCEIECQSHDERHNPIADISKLQALTGWRPEIPLAQTIADTWQFWVERAAANS